MDLLKKPSVDFASVRDGRSSLPLYIDVDLSTARSIQAGTALSINISGNSFYIDADTENTGNAIVHFQDTNFSRSTAPFFVSPGFIANIPFTQILIENAAQAKRLRIFYGVDCDFQAGVNASIAISGRVDVNDVVGPNCAIVAQNLSGAVGTNITNLVATGANLNGLIVRELHMSVAPSTTGGSAYMAIIAAQSAPTTIGPKSNAICLGYLGQNANTAYVYLSKHLNCRIPSGWGIWGVDINNVVVGYPVVNLSYETI